jgi:hypothetical protein
VGISTFSFAQGKDLIDSITVKVDPYKSATNGAFFTHMALSCSDRRVDYIDGFDFEWGYSYELKLKRTKLAQPMQDAGDTDYELISIISKNAVEDSTTFETTLKGWVQLAPNLEDDDGAFTFNSDGSCTYLGELTFYCDDSLLDKLKSINKTEAHKKGTFMFVDRKIHLISIN